MENLNPQKPKIEILLYFGSGFILKGLYSAYTGLDEGRVYSRFASLNSSILTILVGALLIALYFISDRFPGTYRDFNDNYHTVEYDFAEQFIQHIVNRTHLVECFIFNREVVGDQIPFRRIELPEIRARGPALIFGNSDETRLVIELFHLANGKYINSDEVVVERDQQQYYLRLVPIPEATQFQEITG